MIRRLPTMQVGKVFGFSKGLVHGTVGKSAKNLNYETHIALVSFHEIITFDRNHLVNILSKSIEL